MPIWYDNQYESSESIRIVFLYGLVPPSPSYGVTGLPKALFVLLKNGTPFVEITFVVNTCQQFGFLPILENTKQARNAIPCRKIVEIRSELSCRPDWWPKRCPIFVNIVLVCIFGISGTVPTHSTAYVHILERSERYGQGVCGPKQKTIEISNSKVPSTAKAYFSKHLPLSLHSWTLGSKVSQGSS